jgi:ketosteroid isomerase-like protein
MAVMIAGVSLSIAQTNAPATGSQPAVAKADQTLQALEREWANAVVQRDVETISRIQADEFEFTDPAGQIWTKTRELDFIKSGRLQIDSFEMTEFRIRIYGDAAVVNFRVVWNGKSGDNDISGAQRMTDVFVLRDGSWRCVSSHTTRIPPPRNGPGGNG